MFRMILVVLATVLTAAPMHAQPINVVWNSTADDMLGRRLATSVRERLAASPLFSLVYDRDVAALKVSLVTINPDRERRDDQTVYSLVFSTHFRGETFDRFVNQYVGFCGAQRMGDCTETVFSVIDEVADDIRMTAASR